MVNNNKVALVTGGAMGYREGGPSIGGAISIRLAKEGYGVAVVDTGQMGQRAVEIIRGNGGNALFIKADVTNTDDVKRIIKETEAKFGALHCLVNCVARYGPGMAKNIVDVSENDRHATLNVNHNGYFKMAKYSIPLMLRSGGGTVVNISSLGSVLTLPNFAVYSVSKAAVEALTRTIAVDFAPMIRANAVLPGFVKIANSENNRNAEELEQCYSQIAR